MAANRKQLIQAVAELLDRSSNQKRTAQAIAAYLIAERRTVELGTLMRGLEEFRYHADGALEITAYAARSLSPEAKRQIESLFDAKTKLVHEELDEDALGGVRLRALDKVADFSVQARLQKLKRGS